MVATTTRQARDRLANLIGRARFAGERTVITSHGEPAAAIVPIEDLRRLESFSPATTPTTKRAT